MSALQHQPKQRVTLTISKKRGEGGIRTLDRLSPIPVFETGAFDHSATSPGQAILVWHTGTPRPLLERACDCCRLRYRRKVGRGGAWNGSQIVKFGSRAEQEVSMRSKFSIPPGQGFAMRRTSAFVVLVSLFYGVAAPAQTAPYDAEIRQRPAEVRGGPSTIYPPTGRMGVGTRIKVKREENGWLAVSPPPGSSSWVMERFLDQQPTPGRPLICTIVGDESATIPVLLGSADQSIPIPYQVATLKRGTMVVVLGERATSDALGERTTFWRIQPTATEVRWVSKDTIQPAIASAAPVPPMNTARTFGKPVPELWTLAEQAERSGNSSLAAVYYRQLAAQQSLPGGDYNLAAQATARADALTRLTATPTSRPSYSAPAPSATNTGPGPWASGTMYTSGPGYLRRVAFLIDNQPTFALEDDRGYPRLYVVAQPGLTLEPFVNRKVNLFGTMNNRQDMTIHGYMSVKTLHLLR